LQHDITRAIALKSFIGDRGTRDVAAQAFEFLTVMLAAAHPGTRSQRDAIGARGRMQEGLSESA
jgi:hypothetical protein